LAYYTYCVVSLSRQSRCNSYRIHWKRLETVSHGRKKSHSSMDFRCSLVTRDI